jgi:pimeloyl-ACP methyl ester carboxylesterase
VILQPGLGLAAPQYTTLAEDLASQGYIVAGVTPTYSANLTVLHGQAIHATKTGNPPFEGPNLHTGKDERDGNRLVGIWATDARAVAARIRTLDNAGRFARHVDATRTLYMGHSFGGAAALEACRTDPHCVGAADLDGTQFGPVTHTGLAKPFLILTSQSSSCLTGTCKPAGPAERADRTTARSLLAAGTAPDYSAYYIAAPLRSLLPLGETDGEQALTSTGDYLTAFANHTARDKGAAMLDVARCA